MKPVILIGYSGHGLVAAEIFTQAGVTIMGYCDQAEKEKNPFRLPYLGTENDLTFQPHEVDCFVAIGDPKIREKVQRKMQGLGFGIANCVHPSALIGAGTQMEHGIMIGAAAAVQPCCSISEGAILNTSSSTDHECQIGAFAHVGPGTVLCGNVTIGRGSFVGAGSVVRQGITIGDHVMIGAGSVVVKDIPDGLTAMGNPARVKGH
jgi:sugar O-acyltransferase (sialic acid O-acetyltransferase NeuD family)